MLKVSFVTYAGTTIPLGRGLSRAEAKELVRSEIRRAKKRGQPVTKIGKGEWEFESPENAFMVTSNEGWLLVNPDNR